MDDGPALEDLNLGSVTNREELAAALRELHLRADSPSLRSLERWAASREGVSALSKATVSDMIRGRRFPKRALLETFVQACGIPADQLAPWRQAWTRIAGRERARAIEQATELQRQRELLLTDVRKQAAEIIADAEARAHKIILAAAAESGVRAPDPGTPLDGAWAVFKQEILSRLPSVPGELIIVRDHTEHRRYVEIRCEEDAVHAETPNRHVIDGIPEEMLLTPADEQTLTAAGWEPPFRDVGQFNWWTNLPRSSASAAATAVIVALRNVQKVRSTSVLEFWSAPETDDLLADTSDWTSGLPE